MPGGTSKKAFTLIGNYKGPNSMVPTSHRTIEQNSTKYSALESRSKSLAKSGRQSEFESHVTKYNMLDKLTKPQHG